MTAYGWFECSVGDVGQTSVKESVGGDEVRVKAVVPALVGWRQDVFAYDTRANLIPYLPRRRTLLAEHR